MSRSDVFDPLMLRQYRLKGVEETKRVLGRGAYASVFRLKYRGLICAGKRVHTLLYSISTPEAKRKFVKGFKDECRMHSNLRHPNIVQFLGVHYSTEAAAAARTSAYEDDEVQDDPSIPFLVMEYLPITVAKYAEESEPLPPDPLPPEICHSILHDVALGLRYLHERKEPIVHRDLTANNVLLTEQLVAKIADLGVARILDIEKKKLTQAPGNVSYMPPEALDKAGQYHTPIDIFSFGVLSLHIFAREWPFPEDEVFRPDPANPDSVEIRSETQRRLKYIEMIGHDHPIMNLIKDCLLRAPDRRPSAHKILQRIQEIRACFPSRFKTRLEARRAVAIAEKRVKELTEQLEEVEDQLRGKQKELVEKEKKLVEKDFIIGDVKRQILQITSPLGAVTPETFTEQEPTRKPRPPSFVLVEAGGDFISSCIDSLRELKQYITGSTSFAPIEKLVEAQTTADKGVMVTFLGYHNSGKTALLNALVACTLLPVSMKSETSVEMKVIHNPAYHAGPCEERLCSTCPGLLEAGKPEEGTDPVTQHWKIQTIRGIDATQTFLKNVNRNRRAGKMVPVEIIVHAHIPMIEKAKFPLSGSIHLIDTPGFGGAVELESLLKTRLGSPAAAYVYTMSYSTVDDDVHMTSIKLLHARDPTLFKEKRLVVAITQYDDSFDDFSEVEDISSGSESDYDTVLSDEALKKAVSKRIELTVRESFPRDRIVCVSGQWGQIAREYRYRPNDEKQWKKLIRALQFSGVTSTEGRDAVQLVALLEDISRMQLLEKMMTEMIKKCFISWIKTTSSTCCRLIDDVIGKLQDQLAGEKVFPSWDTKLVQEKEQQLNAKKEQIIAQATDIVRVVQ